MQQNTTHYSIIGQLLSTGGVCSKECDNVFFPAPSNRCVSCTCVLRCLHILQHSKLQNLSLTFLVNKTKRIALVIPWPESPIPCIRVKKGTETEYKYNCLL